VLYDDNLIDQKNRSSRTVLPAVMVIKYRDKAHPDDRDISANCIQFFVILLKNV